MAYIASFTPTLGREKEQIMSATGFRHARAGIRLLPLDI